MGGGKNSKPSVREPAPEPTRDDPEVQANADKIKKQQQLAAAQQNTNPTGGTGVINGPNNASATLTGGTKKKTPMPGSSVSV